MISCVDKQTESNDFIVKGTFQGINTSELIVGYENEDYTFLFDTIPIVNNYFSIRGKVNGSLLITIVGNNNTNSIDDPNVTSFFVEAGLNEVILKENEFKKIIVKNSTTHLEHYELNKTLKLTNDNLRNLVLERTELESDSSCVNRNLQIEKINETIRFNLKIIRKKKLDYILNHKSSFLSPYLITYYRNTLTLDSLEFYYNGLSANVKNSHYGKNVLNQIELETNKVSSNIGDSAFKFTSYNLNHEKISLKSFQGSYVLLDFWASWCAPCRTEHPDLRELSRNFIPKGLEIISLSVDRDKEKWKKAIEVDSINLWHHIFLGEDANLISSQYNVESLPTYILIDNQGLIKRRYESTEDQKSRIYNLLKDLTMIYNEY